MVALVEHLSEYPGFRQGIAAWMESHILSALRFTFDRAGTWQRFIRHSRERDRAAVQEHYDLSNEFYKIVA